MKVLLVVSSFPIFANGFSMTGIVRGGQGYSVAVGKPNGLSLYAQAPRDIDDAFENLKKELDDSREATVDEVGTKSKQWVNRYFDFFAGINRDMMTSEEEAEHNERELRKQRELANKLIDFAVELGQDLSSLDLDGIKSPNRKNDIRSNPAKPSPPGQGAFFEPLYSIKDGTSVFQVNLELPGVDVEDINIELGKEEEDVLIICGKRRSLSSEDALQFSKRFGLPSNVDKERITANLEKGILTVNVPKHEKNETVRRVPIAFKD